MVTNNSTDYSPVQHGVQIGGVLGTLVSLPIGTNGQVLLGATGADPMFATLTSTGGTITYTTGPNSLNLDVTTGGVVIEKVNVQTGTTPITPTAGAITINGAVVAAGTNPVRTHGTATSVMAIEVQIAQAIASTDATKIGLCNFNSTDFTVDANGFVTLTGSGADITINGDSGTVTGSTFTFNANQNSGSSVTFFATGTDVLLKVTDNSNNTLIGIGAGNGSITGSSNTGFGSGALHSLTSGINNACFASGTNITSGSANTSMGVGATIPPTGSNNVFIGQGVIPSATNESNNIFIWCGNGVTGDNGVLRIGQNGTITKSYIQGIVGVNPSNAQIVTIDSTNGQMGVVPTPNSIITTWSSQSGTFSALPGNGYFITGTATANLPSGTTGDRIAFILVTSNILTIQAFTANRITIGKNSSSLTGTCVSSFIGDSIDLIYQAPTVGSWYSIGSPEGTWGLT